MSIPSNFQARLDTARVSAYRSQYEKSRWWERALIVNTASQAAFWAGSFFSAVNRYGMRLPGARFFLHVYESPPARQLARLIRAVLRALSSVSLFGQKKLLSPQAVERVSAFILRRFAEDPDQYPALKTRYFSHEGWKFISPEGFIPKGELSQLGIYRFFYKYRNCEDLFSYLPMQEKLDLLENSPDRIEQCRQMLQVWREKRVVFLGPLSIEQVQRKYARALIDNYFRQTESELVRRAENQILKLLENMSVLGDTASDPFSEISELQKGKLAGDLMDAIRHNTGCLQAETLGVSILCKFIQSLGWDHLFANRLLQDLPPHKLYFSFGRLFNVDLHPASTVLRQFQASANGLLVDRLRALEEQHDLAPDIKKVRADLFHLVAEFDPWLSLFGLQLPIQDLFCQIKCQLAHSTPYQAVDVAEIGQLQVPALQKWFLSPDIERQFSLVLSS